MTVWPLSNYDSRHAFGLDARFLVCVMSKMTVVRFVFQRDQKISFDFGRSRRVLGIRHGADGEEGRECRCHCLVTRRAEPGGSAALTQIKSEKQYMTLILLVFIHTIHRIGTVSC
jgi:hypothetical protein